MDNQEFMVSLFAAFSVCDINKVYHESLEVFLNDVSYDKRFKELFGEITSENALKEIDALEAFGIVSRKKRFRRVWYINNLSEKTALKMLGLCSREQLIKVLSLGLKYKQLAHLWEEIKEISYDEKYSVITEEFTKEYMKESIRLIKDKRGN